MPEDNLLTEQKVYTNNGNLAVIDSVPKEAKYILDVGCGSGSNGRALIESGCIIDGITLSEAEAKEARNIYRAVIIFNLENGLPPEFQTLQYDCIICSHVLEHIAYPEKLLNDIHHVLKPTGVLLVALPNVMHYNARWKLLLGKFDYEESGIWDYTHLRWYTFKTGGALLQKHGFTILKAWVDGELPFGRITKHLGSKKIRLFLYQILAKFSRNLFGNQLLYLAKK